MTSWIMVSSRCVFGSSTGMRRVLGEEHDQQRRRRRAPGPARAPSRPRRDDGVHLRERKPPVRVPGGQAQEQRRLGQAENWTSRLAPIPSKAEPVSSAARR